MKKTWKKILAAGCAAAMLLTTPGMCVLADEIKEETIVTEAEVPEENVDFVDSSDEDVTDVIKEATIEVYEVEEVVGVGPIQVGDYVTATFDADTGAVEFTSHNNGELWRDWVDKLGVDRKNIKSIRVASGTVNLPADSSGSYYDQYNNKAYYYLFGGLTNLTNLNLSGFDTSNVTNMSEMFCLCTSLTSLDLSNFDTSNVTDMSAMFSCCGLIHLDLSDFDTSNVTNMDSMFDSCKKLSNLDISGFDTSNVTDMGWMFSYCYNLTDLNLSGVDTSNVTDMGWMFTGLISLHDLDLSSFDTSNVRNMTSMFKDCSGLANLDLSGFDTPNLMYLDGTFSGCGSLTKLDLSSFDTSNVLNMKEMFNGCISLHDLDLSSFDTSNVTTMSEMFKGCSGLANLDLSGFDTSWLLYTENMQDIFNGCSNLQLLKTPKKNEVAIELPVIMYDDAGNGYKKMPSLSESIVLTRNKPITKTDISDCEIILSATSYTYNGKAKKPTVTVKNRDTVLTSGTDYTVSYADNTNAGTATVKVTGTGNYKGEKSASFTINKADAKLVFAESTITKNTKDATFTNTLTKTTDGTVTFKSSNTNVATLNSTSGLVTIKGAGTATITAIASEGKNYKAGSVSYKLIVVEETVYYTVAYDPNGGTGTPSSQTKQKNVALTLSSAKPAKQYVIRYNSNGGSVSPASKSVSCTFNNWNTAKNGTGTSYAPGGSYTANADATLYAQWGNSKAGTLATPTRSGYTFTGWFTSATGGSQISSTSVISGNITIYAHWTDPYNLGDETYSFRNYGDSDSWGGHCFGMSVTSSGYENKLLDIKRIGGNDSTPLYSFRDSQIVRQPICYYQAIQGSYSSRSIVAGGSIYLGNTYNITSDWSAVVNYVKDHSYDDKGLLQIGFRKKNQGGHAINFLYYKNVNGQDRIYAYDNNFPDQEVYFYQNAYGNIVEAPVQTFSGAIDCIALRDVRKYFNIVGDFDSRYVVYMAKDAAEVEGYTYSFVEDGSADGDYVMYEIPADRKKITINPKKDNADFIYMGTEYSFGKITDETRGELTFSTLDESSASTNERFVIYENQSSSYKFSDVQDPSHPYYKAIYWAADAGITKGYSDGTFGINKSCTRGEMMMFLWRYAGKQEPKTVSKSPFKDVPKTHTFYKAILWGSQKGITKGYSDGTFGVNRNVSRGECMMFLWRLKNKPAPKAVAKAPFPDVPKSHVFYNAVLWGYQKKITTGFTSGKLKGKFGVNENCSRGQIVTFLYRAK